MAEDVLATRTEVCRQHPGNDFHRRVGHYAGGLDDCFVTGGLLPRVSTLDGMN